MELERPKSEVVAERVSGIVKLSRSGTIYPVLGEIGFLLASDC